MPTNLVLSIKDAMIRYSDTPVFEDLSFNIHSDNRIALVGKNGAGKSTLMNIITGVQEMDQGERWEAAGLTIGYLHQDITSKPNQSVFEYIFEEISHEERELHRYKVDIAAQALELDTAKKMTKLSGGQLRRAGLARSLVEEPDILLLDEPTNHLDLDVIEWLEGYLNAYQGTIVCVSHDRTFLSNITNQVFWLDRGKLRVSPKGFKHFDDWSTTLLEQEERELKNRKNIVAQEVEWASRGVKARRKRNIQRLDKMREMRDRLKEDESAFRRANAKIDLQPLKDIDATSKIVAEFYNVEKTFQHEEAIEKTVILNEFSLRIRRGDRIGVLGKNGSGKTSFLKLLIGALKADKGSIKRKKELEFSYFDQKREDLKPNQTIKKTLCPSGGDYIDVMGEKRHVCGYLKDFLFDPARVDGLASQLSGGQKNRLMLAKILANPKSCLILDEPTNDLDMDTLDMLEDILCQYQGTLIIVSHDRDFLDQTVTKILAFEGNGKVDSCVGGYSDYINKKKGTVSKKTDKRKERTDKTEPKETKKQTVKLTYKLEHELKEIPKLIEKLEKNIQEHHKDLERPDLYTSDPITFHDITKSLSEKQKELEKLEDRWLEIEEMKMERE